MAWMAEESGFDSRQGRGRGKRNFLLSGVQTDTRAHPSCCPMGISDFIPGVNRQRRETDHPPPSSAEVKNMWSYISIPPYVFILWCLIKHKGKFTSTVNDIHGSGFRCVCVCVCVCVGGCNTLRYINCLQDSLARQFN
jgi:hypothetical protein